jgi:hypothetical protein
MRDSIGKKPSGSSAKIVMKFLGMWALSEHMKEPTQSQLYTVALDAASHSQYLVN